MKKLVLVSLMFLFCVSVLTQTVESKEKQVSHSLKLSKPDAVVRVDVSLMYGSIQVEGFKGKTVEIQATVKDLTKVKSNDWENAVNREINTHMDGDNQSPTPSKKGLKKVEKTSINLDIEERNNRVSIESHSNRENIELVLKVPFNSNLELAVNRGEGVSIENVYGNIEIETARGPIRAKGIKGSIVAESSRSDITIVFDEFTLKKPSSLTVHRGNIDVTLPKKASALIEVKSYQGEIYSGIDAEFKSVDKVQQNDERGRQQIVIGGTMQAKLNQGKQKLLLNTYRGDVFVRSK